MNEMTTSRYFRGTLAPLANADFRNLLISNTLWWQAMWMEMIVVGWLVLELTNSAFDVAFVGFCRSAPLLFTGFVAGPLADRLGRIRVILLSQGISLSVLTLVCILILLERITYTHFLIAAIFLGITWSFSWTARRALIPDLIGKDRTVDAMMLESFTQNISRVLGPFASGSLYAILGPKGCYLTLLGISFCSFVTVFLVKSPPHIPLKNQISPFKRMTDGLRYVIHNQAILGSLLVTVAMNFFTFPYQALLPVFTRDILQQGPFELGLLGACNGVGAFFGLYAVNKLRHRFSRGWIFTIGSALQSLCLLLFAFGSTLPLSIAVVGSTIPFAFPLSIVLLILAGTGQSAFGVMQSSIILLAASDDMRDRAMGTLVLAIGTGPLGQLQIGKLAEMFGAPLALGLQTSVAIVAVLTIAACLPGFRARLE
jgi:MFS family permease